MQPFNKRIKSLGLIVCCFLLSNFVTAQLEVNFGATGKVIAGTPLGNGPGWIHHAPNSNRWDSYAGNGGFFIGRNVGSTYLFLNNSGKLGINKNPEKIIDVNAGTHSGVNDGLRVLYSSGNGAALLANNDPLGGWFVLNGTSIFAPVFANAFVVLPNPPSNGRGHMRIHPSDYRPYVDYFNKLETIAHSTIDAPNQMLPRIGLITPSLSSAKLTSTQENVDPTDSSVQGINLTDWAGLNTVVIKHLMEENKQIREELKKIKAELATIKENL